MEAVRTEISIISLNSDLSNPGTMLWAVAVETLAKSKANRTILRGKWNCCMHFDGAEFEQASFIFSDLICCRARWMKNGEPCHFGNWAKAIQVLVRLDRHNLTHSQDYRYRTMAERRA